MDMISDFVLDDLFDEGIREKIDDWRESLVQNKHMDKEILKLLEEDEYVGSEYMAKKILDAYKEDKIIMNNTHWKRCDACNDVYDVRLQGNDNWCSYSCASGR